MSDKPKLTLKQAKKLLRKASSMIQGLCHPGTTAADYLEAHELADKIDKKITPDT